MTAKKLVKQNKQSLRSNDLKGLVKAFERYNKRYLAVGKKPNVKKLLPEDLYSTMRLEGEKITKREAQAFYLQYKQQF